MTTTPHGLKVLIRPCDSGMCPALYTDDSGRVFVQGNKLSPTDHHGLSVASHEAIVEISPELIAFLKSQ
ncbi:MAG: hypothetical protein ACFE0J_04625 [Elainellaceae cyanobacterium]